MEKGKGLLQSMIITGKGAFPQNISFNFVTFKKKLKSRIPDYIDYQDVTTTTTDCQQRSPGYLPATARKVESSKNRRTLAGVDFQLANVFRLVSCFRETHRRVKIPLKVPFKDSWKLSFVLKFLRKFLEQFIAWIACPTKARLK